MGVRVAKMLLTWRRGKWRGSGLGREGEEDWEEYENKFQERMFSWTGRCSMSWVIPSLLVATPTVIMVAAPVYGPLAVAQALRRHHFPLVSTTQHVLLPVNSVQSSRSKSQEDSNGIHRADCKIHMEEKIAPKSQDCFVKEDSDEDGKSALPDIKTHDRAGVIKAGCCIRTESRERIELGI